MVVFIGVIFGFKFGVVGVFLIVNLFVFSVVKIVVIVFILGIFG